MQEVIKPVLCTLSRIIFVIAIESLSYSHQRYVTICNSFFDLCLRITRYVLLYSSTYLIELSNEILCFQFFFNLILVNVSGNIFSKSIQIRIKNFTIRMIEYLIIVHMYEYFFLFFFFFFSQVARINRFRRIKRTCNVHSM